MLSALTNPGTVVAWVAMAVWCSFGCSQDARDGWSPAQLAQIVSLSPGDRLGAPVDDSNGWAGNDEVARFGKALFFEPSLSQDGTTSCASCHDPAHGFSVEGPAGQGVGGPTERHPPGLMNVAYQRWFDWDGKADTLWGQAQRPIESASEHGSSRTEWVRALLQPGPLRQGFEKAFGQKLPPASRAAAWPALAQGASPQEQFEALPGPDRELVAQVFVKALKALGAYQMRLTSFDTRFDRYAQALAQGTGVPSELELSLSQRLGLKVFLGKGRCIVCHNGPLMSDMAFHNLGLPGQDRGRAAGVELFGASAFGAGGDHSDARTGERASWSKYLRATPEDVGQFKTPGLRHVAHTAPYMHTGQFDTLGQVIDFYNTLPLAPQMGHREDSLRPLGLSPKEAQALEAFSGDLDA